MPPVEPVRISTDSRLFAFSRWDLIPVLAELAHFAFVIFLFLAFPHLRTLEIVPATPSTAVPPETLAAFPTTPSVTRVHSSV